MLQPFPVGLFGLHRKMIVVRSVIAASIASTSSSQVRGVSGTALGMPPLMRVWLSKNAYVGEAMTVSSPGPTSNRTRTSSTSVEPLPSTIDSGGTSL